MQERFKVNVRRSCRLALLQPSGWYAKSNARDQSALRLRIREIAMDRPRFGYLRVLVMLQARRLENRQEARLSPVPAGGIAVAHEGQTPQTHQPATRSANASHRAKSKLEHGLCARSDARWADISGAHGDSRSGVARSVLLEANFRLTGRCVGKALDEAALERGLPKAITVDNGTEFTSKALGRLGLAPWCEARLHTAWKAHGQRVDRVVQRSVAR